MTVVDLHPEDLLDKDSRGDLTADERVRLEMHLGRCAACRAERALRLDFAAELEGDDRPSAILGLVQGALRNADADARAKADASADADARAKADADADARRDGIPGLRRRSRRTAVVLLFAAAILAASAAGATGLTGRVWLQIRGSSQDATHAEPATVLPTATPLAFSHASPGPSSAGPIVDPADEQVPAELAPAPVAAPLVAPAPVAAPPVALRTVAFVPASTPSPAIASAIAATPVTAVSPASASAMFDAANAARRAGDTTTALGLYDSLERQFPGSREARSAKATAGRLLLDHGDAAGAVTRFDTYLASGASELREEAMAGRATALERLGRDEDEARAWALLLATYPHTPYASHARARVGRSLPR